MTSASLLTLFASFNYLEFNLFEDLFYFGYLLFNCHTFSVTASNMLQLLSY